jgi:hypothetical protein
MFFNASQGEQAPRWVSLVAFWSFGKFQGTRPVPLLGALITL